MTLEEILAGSGIVVILMTILEIAPIRINPWGAIWKALGRVLTCIGNRINSGVLKELETVRANQEDMQRKLDGHIIQDMERSATECRGEILRFNNELLRGIMHTKEEYIEVLSAIDRYEHYCHDNPDFPNNRALLAIETIKENYKERLARHDFLESYGGAERRTGPDPDPE